MLNYKTVSTLVVDCSDHDFGNFEVLIIPDDYLSETCGQTAYYFYLRHRVYGLVMDMFGCAAETEEYAAELAYRKAPDYIPSYLKEVEPDED